MGDRQAVVAGGTRALLATRILPNGDSLWPEGTEPSGDGGADLLGGGELWYVCEHDAELALAKLRGLWPRIVGGLGQAALTLQWVR